MNLPEGGRRQKVVRKRPPFQNDKTNAEIKRPTKATLGSYLYD